MKKINIIVSIALALLLTASINAQVKNSVDTDIRKQVTASLTNYLMLKDALVSSDPEAASSASNELFTSLNAIDAAKMIAGQKVLWNKIGEDLKEDAEHIYKNKDIGHQRAHFVKLSNNMYAMVSKFKANDAETYYHYCPMKKASWLSLSKEVKNPYYGSKMLQCGSVKATLKKVQSDS